MLMNQVDASKNYFSLFCRKYTHKTSFPGTNSLFSYGRYVALLSTPAVCLEEKLKVLQFVPIRLGALFTAFIWH